MRAGYFRKESVNIILILKIARPLAAIFQLDHQVGNRPENAFPGKPAAAHGNSFEDPGDIDIFYIVIPIDKKTVEIHCLPAESARTDFFAGRFVCLQMIGRERTSADLLRCK